MRFLSYLLLRLIDFYAVTVGPHFGGHCRFEPSCSHYAKEAITRFGPFKGSWLSIVRLVKCGPWHPGGLVPVPDSTNPETVPNASV